jgi:hypothetical protein
MAPDEDRADGWAFAIARRREIAKVLRDAKVLVKEVN